ncbi:TPA: IS3 family transposase [Proteus mirabilis]|nr:IS3 family transposase [Proteus mirabilis]
MDYYQQQLQERGLKQSMSRKGNCLDNTSMESFFEIFKSECFHGKEFKSVNELDQTVKECIHYYNHERIKVKLKGLSPVEYRTQLFSYSVIQLFSYSVIQLFSYSVIQLFSYSVIQLFSY